jgi:hypothetical protein
MTFRAHPNPLGKCLGFNKFARPFPAFSTARKARMNLNDCFFSGTPAAFASI